MSGDFPHDYHPLAPLLRQLRGSLSWYQSEYLDLTEEMKTQWLSRLSALPRQQGRARNDETQRTTEVSQFWSTLPYALEQNTHEESSNPQGSASPQAKIKRGSLPTASFPVVTHERAVVASSSFELPPPKGPNESGSAELMKPSRALLEHRGELVSSSEVVHEAQVQAEDAQLQVDQAQSASEDVPNLKQEASLTKEPLWARRPSPTLSSEARAEPKERTTLGASLARLNQKSAQPQEGSEASLREQLGHQVGQLDHRQMVRARGYDADELFGIICDRIWGCSDCPRARENRMMTGGGHYGARVMFVVAHPSVAELEQRQFLMSGEERALFNSLLKAMKLSRMEVYVTSLLKCGEGEPNVQEWAQCQKHFLDELTLVRPEIIVTLGYLASVILLGVGTHQGVWGNYQEVPVMPTAHPSDILSGGEGLKRSVWRHLREVMRRAGLAQS